MSSKPIQPLDTVLGYTLQDRIGFGGYGEVWSAIAPGGIEKAVKFVYGFHDEKRAQTEIKALDRVKSLRHPFLLSLERIDIVDGQLVIISELADCCLADVFNKYAANGEPGIPREELLVYVRDAADALDYLTQNHSLQHLDIKPENLLIVSGHVKVADFGLVKELDVTAQSLMTGMTPAYAAPELFDGRPGERSDQYSLAIVYQEMLTSIRPFPGSTPAQLAAQHMHGRPNLRPLPKGDQAVIAKALSKDPAVRFSSCREMVDELFNKKLRKKKIRRVQLQRQMEDTDAQTMMVEDTPALRDITAVVSSSSLPFQNVEIGRLDPPELEGREAELQPTIIVSVGNMGSQVALQLKKRLIARHGSTDELPAVRTICIDTDRQTLSDLAHAGHAAMLDRETLLTPLHKPEVYRERKTSHLEWLSRRWIYNVPRSLQTEGLRPLGRLAFADHFEGICAKLQTAIEECSCEENIARTSDSVGLAPGTAIRPRVFIVSSISGGVGGMTLDLAYTIRTLLIERGLDTDSVFGILLHSTNRRAAEPGLAAANSFATLTELRHFTDYGYPGDDALGLPEFHDEPPFDQVYYQDIGTDLSQTELDERFNSIAEWIYLNSLSNCSMFFDACRDFTKDSEHFDLRTFGLSISGPGKEITALSQANSLAFDLIKKWIHGGPNVQFEAKTKAEEFFAGFSLNADGIASKVEELLKKELDSEQLAQVFQQSGQVVADAGSEHGQQLTEFYDRVFGVGRKEQQVGYVEPELVTRFADLVGRSSSPVWDQMSALVIEPLQEENLELSIAFALVQQFMDRLEHIKGRLDVALRGCESQLKDLVSVIGELACHPKRNSQADKSNLLAQCLTSYRDCRWQQFVLRNAKHYCQIVKKNLVSMSGTVERYRDELEMLASKFDSADFSPFDAVSSDPQDIEQLMIDAIVRSQDKLVERMEFLVFENFVRGTGSFLDLLNDSYSIETKLPDALHEMSVQVITDAYKKVSIDGIIAENKIPPEQVVSWLNEQMNNALPLVRQCGGGARLLAGFPQHAQESQLPLLIDQQFSVKPSSVSGTSGDFVLCFEGEEVSLAGVAFRLLELRPDALELSKRIHVRKDIEWTTLNDLL